MDCTMDSEESKAKFKKADEFFRTKQYEDALRILEELNTSFPNKRHVMYPMARCLAKLNYLQDAMDLCDEIYDKFQYRRALKMKKYLGRITLPGLNFDDLDIDDDKLLQQTDEMESDI